MSLANRLVSHDMQQIYDMSSANAGCVASSAHATELSFVSIDTMLPSPDISASSSYSRLPARRPRWHRPTPSSNGPAATLGQARCLTHVGRSRGTDSDEAQRLRRTAGGSAALSLRFATHACGPAGFARAVAFAREPSGPLRFQPSNAPRCQTWAQPAEEPKAQVRPHKSAG